MLDLAIGYVCSNCARTRVIEYSVPGISGISDFFNVVEAEPMKAISIIFLLLMSFAGARAEPGRILGEGNTKCSAWSVPYEGSDSRKPMLEAWVRGFVTAMTTSEKLDTSGLMMWMNQYCRDNPGATIDDAAAFYVELRAPDPKRPLHL
jgi:hypothetical protein